MKYHYTGDILPSHISYSKLYQKLFLKLDGKTHDLKSLVGPYGAKLSYVLYEIDGKAKVSGSDRVYNVVYRRFKYLSRMGLFEMVKGRSGYIPYEKPGYYVRPTGQLFYLFSQVQNSNTAEKSANKPAGQWWDRIYNIPKRCSTDRVSAVKTLMAVQGRAMFQRDTTCPKCKGSGHQVPGKKIAECNKCGMTWRPPINPRLKNELNEVKYHFDEWETAIEDKEIFFDRGPGTAIVRLPCRTRFTDKGRKVHNIKTYDRAWDRANMLYRRGVFVTLTTDPAMHKSLWHANRHLTRAFNRFISYFLSLSRKNKKKGFDSEKDEHDIIDNGISRLKYIAAYEFQENGLIHLHLCFFGIRYLASIDNISDIWQRCGQGRIVHAYGIRRDGDVWMWNKEKPGDADGRSPVDYLRKYLEKALYVNESFSLYWAVNKRFCTMSRVLQTKECAGCRSVWGSQLKHCPACTGPLWYISKGFRYLGTLNKYEGPTAIMMRLNSGFSPFDALGLTKVIA